jgi:hypothetical protein
MLKMLALLRPSSLPSFWKLKEGACEKTRLAMPERKRSRYGRECLSVVKLEIRN